MIKNYIKTALQSLGKNKAYSFLNIFSLAMYLIAGILAVVIALITISFQTIKAALANPVKSLRSE